MYLPLAIAVILLVTPASASCDQRPIGETLPSLREALSTRVKNQGIEIKYIAGEPREGAIYELAPLKTGVRLVADDELSLNEVGTDVAKPFTDKELDAAFTVAAFTIARLSAEPEAKIKDQLYDDLRHHQGDANWNHIWGGTVAVTSSLDRGLVVRIFKADCN